MNEESSGLSLGVLIAIIVVPIVLIVAVIVGVMMYKKNKGAGMSQGVNINMAGMGPTPGYNSNQFG